VIYLGELLAYLDRAEADEVVMQSGQPPRLRVGEEERRLGADPLSRDAILAALHGVAVGAIVPSTDTAGEVQIVRIRGRDYLINIARFLDLLEVRIAGLPGPAAAETGAPSAGRGATRQMQALGASPTGDHPTQRDRGAVGPLAAAALEMQRGDRPTKREASGVGPLASAALASQSAGGSEHATKREAFGVGPLAAAALDAMADLDVDDSDGSALGGHDVEELAAALDLDPTDRLGIGRTPMGATTTLLGPPARARVPHPAAATRPAAPPPSVAPPERARTVAGHAPAPHTAARETSPPADALPPRTDPVRVVPAAATAIEPELPDTVADILAAARAEGASDAHLSSEQPVRVRVAGRLEERGILVDHRLLEATVAKILRPAQGAQLAARGHVDLAFADPAAGRLRINLCRQRGGLKLCARLVAASPPSREQLGLPSEIGRIELLHQGLVVIAGPSGHGKTTTMAALVDALASTRPIHIITVEDPVEIVHPAKRALVTQREIGSHTKSFTAALSAALREDPDVIAIGEMRDRETVEMALTAAETGHLVLATMNTPSGAKTIERLIELFPPEDQSQVRATLCGALKLVISQRLLPRATGRGLVAAYEVITGGPPLWGLIRDRKLHQLPSLLQRGKAFGMRRLEESLRDLMVAGDISEEIAVKNAEDPRVLSASASPGAESWNPRFGGA
jgi:twitching motility protein PilT